MPFAYDEATGPESNAVDQRSHSRPESRIEGNTTKETRRPRHSSMSEFRHPERSSPTPEVLESYNGNRGNYDQAQNRDLPALQVQGPADTADTFQPIIEEEPGSYDLVEAPVEQKIFSLEKQSLALFSKDHLQVIFSDPSLLLRFTAYLSKHRPKSIPLLIHYLDALKAIRTIDYANAVIEALNPLESYTFTSSRVQTTKNEALERRARESFEALAQEELPAYITHLYVNIVSLSISRRITGTLPSHLRKASEGLAEVFCLTDPSRRDNPIVFASEVKYKLSQGHCDSS